MLGMISTALILASDGRETSSPPPTCDSREGVFFSAADFPGTPGVIANKHSTSDELRERISLWRTEYTEGPLTEAQHAQFFDEGFVIVHDILPHPLLHSAIGAVEGLVDDLAERLLVAGKIKNAHKDADFQKRLSLIEKEFPHANVLLHKNGMLPLGIANVWSHPRLIGVARQLLGQTTDIFGHPVWNLRCKTPERLSDGQATVPWHQDNAYLDEESWDKLQLTAWVPLVDTNVSNGCMQVVAGGHRSGRTATHACCVGGTWYVETTPEELEATLGADMGRDVVTCEVPLGGVLLLNNLVPHRSLPNDSEGIRWSLDLRWQRGGEPNGFSGIKDSVLMKAASDTSYNGTVAWGPWATADRNTLTQARLASKGTATGGGGSSRRGKATGAHDFSTTIAGPWMRNWPLVHENRHTAQLPKETARAA
jgi:ectoine hydroxylase-related dioxygenase (phytanoyl-CoA dioxygenase family)